MFGRVQRKQNQLSYYFVTDANRFLMSVVTLRGLLREFGLHSFIYFYFFTDRKVFQIFSWWQHWLDGFWGGQVTHRKYSTNGKRFQISYELLLNKFSSHKSLIFYLCICLRFTKLKYSFRLKTDKSDFFKYFWGFRILCIDYL